MRTLSLTLLAAFALAAAGCEKVVHEAPLERPPLPTAERVPDVVPAVDGVPMA